MSGLCAHACPLNAMIPLAIISHLNTALVMGSSLNCFSLPYDAPLFGFKRVARMSDPTSGGQLIASPAFRCAHAGHLKESTRRRNPLTRPHPKGGGGMPISWKPRLTIAINLAHEDVDRHLVFGAAEFSERRYPPERVFASFSTPVRRCAPASRNPAARGRASPASRRDRARLRQ